jgi:DNA-nicking Smr family endonuclease
MLEEDQGALELPLDGVLDLHTFRPADIGDLVPAYLAECRQRGILQVRVVHGKGIGNLKRSVHAILSRLPEVTSAKRARTMAERCDHCKPAAARDREAKPFTAETRRREEQ